MVEVNGTPLLVNAINNLTDLGIKDIGIVVGHMADYIKGRIGNKYNGADITYYDNPRYLETNNIVPCTKRLTSAMMICFCWNVISITIEKCWSI